MNLFSKLFLIVLTSTISIAAAQTNNFNIKVKAGIPKEKALQVQYSNSKQWEPFYGKIENFDYDPKNSYELQVKRTKIQNPKPDKSHYRYTLVHSKQQIRAENEQVMLIINDQLVDCVAATKMTCMQVKYHENDPWEFFHANIKGFTYQQGYTYKILINKIKLPNPPQDASAYRYELVKVLEKKSSAEAERLPTIASYLSRFKWKVISLNGKQVGQYNAFILFDEEKGQVSGNASCNNFFGPFRIIGNKIQFPNLASTMRACLGENIESDLFHVLEDQELTFDVAEQTFNLYSNQKLIAIFGANEKQ